MRENETDKSRDLITQDKVFADDLHADDHERIERRISDLEASIKMLESRMSTFDYKLDDQRRRMRWLIN